MPRSLLEILLEKKEPKKSLPYPTREDFNTALLGSMDICFRTLSDLGAIEGFGGVKSFGSIRDQLKDSYSILKKYVDEWKDYPWNDPAVQKQLLDQTNTITKLINDLKKARVDSLGEGDSYRIANTYFTTAESLRTSGTQKILKIASMRDKEIKVDRARANTDLTENNEINKNKLDITAKKVSPVIATRPKDMSDDDFKKLQEQVKKDNEKIDKDNEERDNKAVQTRMGMFYYLGMIVGETQSEVEAAWGGGEKGELDPDATQRAYRIQLLQKAMPFIERVTQKDFDDKNPFGDEEYINYIMILGSYTPGFKNYKPDLKDEGGKMEITPEQYKTIGVDMDKKKKSILDLIKKVKDRHNGNGPIDKAIVKEMADAEMELASVDSETACDINSKKKLNNAAQKLREKVEESKSVLEADDIKDLNQIGNLIEEIFSYCQEKKYIKEIKK